MMNRIKEYIIEYKSKVIFLTVMTIIFLIGLVIVSNNYSLYKKTIVKVTSVNSKFSRIVDGENQNTEKYYKQDITAKVMNGKSKGKIIEFTSEYSSSGLKTEKYNKGDKLFVDITNISSTVYKVAVTNVKRDNHLYFVAGIFILFMLAVSRKIGVLTVVSLIINAGAVILALKFMPLEQFLDFGWIVIGLTFIVLTLIFAAGFSRKTLGAIIATIFTVGIIYFIYTIALFQIDDIPYDMMEYIFSSLDFERIYMVSIIFGTLGAIMDVAITINASVSEIMATTPEIKPNSLIKSIRKISNDIMGTMINVLFFSYISSSLIMVILKLHSGFSFITVVKYTYVFDILRFLVGSIGIVLAIPVSGIVAYLVMKRLGVKKC